MERACETSFRYASARGFLAPPVRNRSSNSALWRDDSKESEYGALRKAASAAQMAVRSPTKASIERLVCGFR
jgi:hypothetical protein